MYLIDTNVLSELPKRAPDPGVLAWMSKQEDIVISAISLEELAFGIARSRLELQAKLQRWFESLMRSGLTVLPIDEELAVIAGRLRASREALGRPVQQADMLIAAEALRTGRIVVTRNVRDFEGCAIALLNPFSA